MLQRSQQNNTDAGDQHCYRNGIIIEPMCPSYTHDATFIPKIPKAAVAAAPWAASMVQHERSRSTVRLTIHCFSRVSIWFRGQILSKP
jgi:hypothetical protein